MENAFQAMKLKLVHERGHILRHQNLGIATVIGGSTNALDLSQQEVVQSIQQMIADDSRYSELTILRVVPNDSGASSLNVFLEVRLSGTGTLLPISFAINTTG